jgi:hypothetical protein
MRPAVQEQQSEALVPDTNQGNDSTLPDVQDNVVEQAAGPVAMDHPELLPSADTCIAPEQPVLSAAEASAAELPMQECMVPDSSNEAGPVDQLHQPADAQAGLDDITVPAVEEVQLEMQQPQPEPSASDHIVTSPVVGPPVAASAAGQPSPDGVSAATIVHPDPAQQMSLQPQPADAVVDSEPGHPATKRTAPDPTLEE